MQYANCPKVKVNFCTKYITTSTYKGDIIKEKKKGNDLMVSEAQKRATTKYEHINYDKITVRVPKGTREIYKAHAESKGESLNAYIIRLIEQDIQNDKKSK